METLADPPPWRWVILDRRLRVIAYGTQGPWPAVGDINAAADEILAQHAAVQLRDHGRVDGAAGLVCRVWRGGVGFNEAGEPVDDHGVVVEYGQSVGDGWLTAR